MGNHDPLVRGRKRPHNSLDNHVVDFIIFSLGVCVYYHLVDLIPDSKPIILRQEEGDMGQP